MKSNKITIIALAAMALSGCNFLDNNSPSAIDSKVVFSDPVKTEHALFAVYDLMGANNGYRNRIACGFAGLNTDTEWSTYSTKNDNAGKLALYDCGITNDRISNTGGSDIWTYLNQMIERSNNAIEGLREYGNVENDEVMRYYLGEALFLRSFAYLEMVKYWGDVPARFVSIAKDDKGIKAPKADRNLVYEQLRKDLTEAASLMPWSPEVPVASAKNNVGRANKAAALALLARADLMYAGKAVRPGADGFDINEPDKYAVVYNIQDAELRKAVYKEALEACAQIIDREDHKLAADFKQPFRQICMGVTAYDQMEHIWVMPFKYGSRGQVMNYNAPKLSSDAQSAVKGHLPGYDGGSASGVICVSPNLINKYAPEDKRLAVTVVPGQWEYNNGEGENKSEDVRAKIFPNHAASASKLYQKHTSISSFFIGKYRYEWYGEAGMKHSSTDDGVSFPVLRYADVLLMFAEAELGGWEGLKPAKETTLNGIDQLNKVRSRAGLAKLDSYTMDNIDEERAKEFCGEYIRKYDLMRWGMLKERMVAAQANIRAMSMDASRHNMNMGDSLYYKYKWNETIQGYEIDVETMYGLRPGEQDRLPEMTPENGWQAKDVYNSDSKGYLLGEKLYPIFESEEQLETRQYWPIFQHNVTAAGTDVLWNNYGYGL